MKIDISSRIALQQRLNEYDYDALISINSPARGPIPELAYWFFKPTLTLIFDDISEPFYGFRVPEESHVVEIIDFAKTQAFSRNASSMIIHCDAGISRSSAAAVIVAATVTDNIEAYISSLFNEGYMYHPNYKMIKMFEKITGREDISPLLRKYGNWYG